MSVRLWNLAVIALLLSQKLQAKPIERLVSIGGGISEIVCALDFCDKIVAVDATSLYPETLQKLPNLGYYRQLNTEGLLKQRADLILLTEQAGPPSVIAQLKALKAPLHYVNADKTLDGTKKRIMEIGKLLGAENKAKELIKKMEEELSLASAQLNKRQQSIKALFIYASGRHQLMAAGKNTAGDTMFQLLGLENAASELEGYVNLSAEGLLKMNPDLIVMTHRAQEMFSQGEQQTAALNVPGVELTSAGKNKRTIFVDDLLFLGFSHRLGEAALDFALKLKEVSWQSDSH